MTGPNVTPTPLDAVHALHDVTPLPPIVRARGTDAGYFVSLGIPLKIARAAIGEPYAFDDPATGLEIVEDNNNIAEGPVAGSELSDFLADPSAAEEIDVPAIGGADPGPAIDQAPNSADAGAPAVGPSVHGIADAANVGAKLAAENPHAPHELDALPSGTVVTKDGMNLVATTGNQTVAKMLDPSHPLAALPDGSTVQRVGDGIRLTVPKVSVHGTPTVHVTTGAGLLHALQLFGAWLLAEAKRVEQAL